LIGLRARGGYGKGHHAAALNYGDCFSYALAVTRGEPLLFKDEDFAKTDVTRPGDAALR
jgi:ribonuclease VapC